MNLPETIAVDRPDPQLIQSTSDFLDIARQSYTDIKSSAQCEAAGEDLRLVKLRQKQLEEARTRIAKPLLDAQRAVNQLFKAPQEALAEAERIIKGGILGFQEREAASVREAEAKAAQTMRKERERLEERIVKAEAAGNFELADTLRLTVTMIPSEVHLPAGTTVSGIAQRSQWRAMVTDFLALVRYVAKHPEWLQLLQPNDKALNGLARSQRAALTLPGVKSLQEKQLSARSL